MQALLHYYDKKTGKKSRRPPQFAKKGAPSPPRFRFSANDVHLSRPEDHCPPRSLQPRLHRAVRPSSSSSLKRVAKTSFRSFEDHPQLGRFTLRDEGKTIAIGKVTKLITVCSFLLPSVIQRLISLAPFAADRGHCGSDAEVGAGGYWSAVDVEELYAAPCTLLVVVRRRRETNLGEAPSGIRPGVELTEDFLLPYPPPLKPTSTEQIMSGKLSTGRLQLQQVQRRRQRSGLADDTCLCPPTDYPSWAQLQSLYDADHAKLVLKDLFAADPERFAKFSRSYDNADKDVHLLVDFSKNLIDDKNSRGEK